MTRRVALVGPLRAERVALHTGGFPLNLKDMLPVADVVLMIDNGNNNCMLFRYTAHGELAGDTPHDSAAEAVAQAELEYGEALLDWIDVPPDAVDAHVFAVNYAAERLNERE
jgi:hypothetical protein